MKIVTKIEVSPVDLKLALESYLRSKLGSINITINTIVDTEGSPIKTLTIGADLEKVSSGSYMER